MRSTAFARLLGDRVELARQTIYFAESSTLNDPAEAIRGFVWRGDTIAWTSFFRHYVNCLHHIYLLMRLSESNQHVGAHTRASIQSPDHWTGAPALPVSVSAAKSGPRPSAMD